MPDIYQTKSKFLKCKIKKLDAALLICTVDYNPMRDRFNSNRVNEVDCNSPESVCERPSCSH